MTMKNKITAITLCLLSFVLITSNTSVHALEINHENSTTSVSFENDSVPTKPVNPLNPQEDSDPGDVVESMNPGTLAIIAYPKTMSFGNQKVGHGVQTFEADLLKPNVQLKDFRGAASNGWNLSVGLSDFVNPEVTGAGRSVPGFITFDNTEFFIGSSSYELEPSTINSQIVVGSGEQALIASAKDGEGRGIWGFHWYAPNYETASTNSNVTLGMNTNLVVPGNYSANLEWTLSATPN